MKGGQSGVQEWRAITVRGKRKTAWCEGGGQSGVQVESYNSKR